MAKLVEEVRHLEASRKIGRSSIESQLSLPLFVAISAEQKESFA